MPYDYQLVGGCILFILCLVSFINALIEKHRPYFGLLGMIIGAGLVYWAWEISEQSLNIEDVPNAFIRILALII